MGRVSKRLRFEILRRDNFQCVYCGARPPETELRVDHVVPEALGGPSVPTNLAASCEPCNSGKTSIAPDSAMVESVEQDALRWAAAMRQAGEMREREREIRDAHVDSFETTWSEFTYGPQGNRRPVPLPPDWAASIRKFYDQGLPWNEMYEAVQTAMGAQNVTAENTWRYFCGVCWRSLEDMRNRAAALLALEDGDR